MIYFSCVYLTETVHAQGLGFTKMVMKNAEADTKDEAARLISKWADSKKLKVRKIDVTDAVQQDINRYAFPEQILRAPKRNPKNRNHCPTLLINATLTSV